MKSLTTMDRVAIASMLSVAFLIAGAEGACAADMAQAHLTLPNGVERAFFTSGPLGVTTYRVDTRGGAVVAKVQVLTDDAFNQIAYGATSDQVFQLIGPPAAKARFPLSGNTTWDYHYRDSWGYDAEFSVTFDATGVVVGKFSARDSG